MLTVVFGIIIYIISFLGLWKMFEKADQSTPFLRALVPFWNLYTIFKISWNPAAFLGLIILVVIEMVLGKTAIFHGLIGGMTGIGFFRGVSAGSGIAAVIISVLICIWLIVMWVKLAKAFGHGVLWGILMWILPWIMTMITGFGSSRYIGPRS